MKKYLRYLRTPDYRSKGTLCSHSQLKDCTAVILYVIIQLIKAKKKKAIKRRYDPSVPESFQDRGVCALRFLCIMTSCIFFCLTKLERENKRGRRGTDCLWTFKDVTFSLTLAKKMSHGRAKLQLN